MEHYFELSALEINLLIFLAILSIFHKILKINADKI